MVHPRNQPCLASKIYKTSPQNAQAPVTMIDKVDEKMFQIVLEHRK